MGGIVLSERESQGNRDQSKRYPLKMLSQSVTLTRTRKNLLEIDVRYNVAN